MNSVGLYIHVPFCLSKCPYCDFYSVKYDEHTAKEYIKAVKRNISAYNGVKFDTVYFGGGTPILLWREISGLLTDIGGMIENNAEITVEANPCCTDKESLDSLYKSGVNRISFGLQSSDDNELKALGRRHNAAMGEKAVKLAFNAGIRNISADIMLGITKQTPDSLRETIRRFTSLPLTHISAYMLKIEPGTPFAAQRLKLPDEDGYADIYLETVSLLGQNGFKQYEISNFAKSGFECRHNLKYWRCEEYIGIGPAAHSYYNGKRYAVPRSVAGFIADNLQEAYITENDPADPEEYMMLRLRLSEGVDINELQRLFGVEKAAVLDRLGELPPKLYRRKGDIISLTPEGFLVSNAVIGILTNI